MDVCQTHSPLLPRWWRTAAEKRSPVSPMSPGVHLPRFASPTNSGGRRIVFATDQLKQPAVTGPAGARLGKPSEASLPRAQSTDSARPQRSADQGVTGRVGRKGTQGSPAIGPAVPPSISGHTPFGPSPWLSSGHQAEHLPDRLFLIGGFGHREVFLT